MSLRCNYAQFFEGWNRMFIHEVDGIEEVLAGLAERYRLYALSNTSPAHIEYLIKKYSFFGCFSHIITSYELGMLKPALSVYKKVEEKYFSGEKPVLFIDDIHENVLAAREAGWPAYRFEGVEKLKSFLKKNSI
jgi:putative hydrolase of the HAD superfamily